MDSGIQGVFRVRGLLRIFATCFLRPDERIVLHALIQLEETHTTADGAEFVGVSIMRLGKVVGMSPKVVEENIRALDRYQLVHRMIPEMEEELKAKKARRKRRKKDSNAVNASDDDDDDFEVDDFESEGSVAELTSSSDDEETALKRLDEEEEIKEMRATRYAVDYRKGVQMASTYFKRLLAKLCGKISPIDLDTTFTEHPAEVGPETADGPTSFHFSYHGKSTKATLDGPVTNVLFCLRCEKAIPVQELHAETLCPICPISSPNDLVRSTLLRAHRILVDPARITPESFRDQFERIYREYDPGGATTERLDKIAAKDVAQQTIGLVKLFEQHEPHFPIHQRLVNHPLSRAEFERVYREYKPGEEASARVDEFMALDLSGRRDELRKLYKEFGTSFPKQKSAPSIPLPDCLRNDVALLQLGLTVYSFINERFVSLADPEMRDDRHAVISAHDIMTESEVQQAARQSQSTQALMYKPQALHPKLISEAEISEKRLLRISNKLFRQAQQPSFLQSNVNSKVKNQTQQPRQTRSENMIRNKRGREDVDQPLSSHLLPPWLQTDSGDWERVEF